MSKFSNQLQYSYDVDSITGQSRSLADMIRQLADRVKVLEEENINLTNELYRLENSLDARIDILAASMFSDKSNV